MSRDRLLAHVRTLEGERHPSLSPAHLRAAQGYVQAHWRSHGITCALDEFSYMDRPFVNLIGRLRPDAAGPRLLIGAHLDTVPDTPGADDNASGVAVLLEAARVLATSVPDIPVEFAAFTLEEVGMIGSTHYAERLHQAKVPLIGMLSLEMVGFTETEGLQRSPWFLRGRVPTEGTYLGLAGNQRSGRLLQIVADAMRTVPDLPLATLSLPMNGRLFPESRLSDHAPFWDRGFPALLATDTSFFRNPHYHQPSDTLATLDFSFMERVCQGVVAAAEALTQGD